jgi:hypothetical protein
MALSDLAVGTLRGQPTSFAAAHRDSNSTAITTSVVLTVPMSHEDAPFSDNAEPCWVTDGGMPGWWASGHLRGGLRVA